METNKTRTEEIRRLTTPRAAAVAGILFALLFTASLILLRSAIPERLTSDVAWVATGYQRITIALGLMPFAGIAYLWFIGVVRDKLGDYEDRFFSSVFYGSSLIFLGMVFVAMAIVGGLVAGYRLNPGIAFDSQVIYFSRAMMIQLSNIYALRMAGVTMISLATILLRTGLAPRWLVLVTYALSLALLVVVNFSLWITLIFPAWVTMISLFILWFRFNTRMDRSPRPNNIYMIAFKPLTALYSLLVILILVLTACLPALEVTPEETVLAASPTPVGIHTSGAEGTPLPTDENTQAEEPNATDRGEEILIIPTLAPTATPGAVYEVVNQVVEAKNLYDTSFLSLSVADWINLALSFALVLLALTLISRLIFIILMKIAKRSPTPYVEIYLKTIRPFFHWLFVIIILYFSTIRLQFLSPALKQGLGKIYYAVIVVLVCICLWKLMDIVRLWYQQKTADKEDRNSREAALSLGERAIRGLVVLAGMIIILSHFGVNISALWTAIGIGGLALSLAAQDTLANMISGIIILLDQPFRTGDRIEIQELNTWGDVISIGLRSTRIRTLDNRLVIVPNAGISNNQVVNYTYPDPRYRIETEIGVAYGSDLRHIRQVIIESLKGVEGVIPDKPVDVLFMNWGDSEMVMRVRWWIESYIDARRSTDRVNEHIYQALEEAGVETPFPTMTVELMNREQGESPSTFRTRKKDE